MELQLFNALDALLKKHTLRASVYQGSRNGPRPGGIDPINPIIKAYIGQCDDRGSEVIFPDEGSEFCINLIGKIQTHQHHLHWLVYSAFVNLLEYWQFGNAGLAPSGPKINDSGGVI